MASHAHDDDDDVHGDPSRFAYDLGRAGISAMEAKPLIEKAYGEGVLSRATIFRLVKAGKERTPFNTHGGSRPKETVAAKMRTAELINAVREFVQEDRRVTVIDVAENFNVSTGTAFTILHSDLWLSKKSARWVPKLLSEDNMRCRVETAREILRLDSRLGLAFRRSVVTMDETMVSFHTPETKERSKQWLPKGSPGPVKAKVIASRKKQMVLSFFDHQGLIFQRFSPLGTSVNGDFIVEALKKFLTAKSRKRPDLGDAWRLHWDNAPVHTSRVVKAFLEEKAIEVVPHPPYSPDLAPADYFLFPTMKRELGGVSISGDSVKVEWERACGRVPSDAFAAAFDRWIERLQKCVEVRGNYVEKVSIAEDDADSLSDSD